MLKSGLLLLLVGTVYCATGVTDYNDQDNWPGSCTTGNMQSPIDIRSADSEAHYDFGLEMPTLNVTHSTKPSTVFFEITDKNNILKMPSSWPVGHTKGLQLLQVHVHWGDGAHTGSEHHLYGVTYSSEMHLVTRNLDQSDSTQFDYYAVFGVFLDEDKAVKNGSKGRSDTDLDDLLLNMFDFDRAENLTEIDFSLLYKRSAKSMMTYEGSLTTPECNEMVFWQVLEEPIPIKPSTAQLLRDFQLNGGVVGKTNRDIQPLNGRKIVERFLNEGKDSSHNDNSGRNNSIIIPDCRIMEQLRDGSLNCIDEKDYFGSAGSCQISALLLGVYLMFYVIQY